MNDPKDKDGYGVYQEKDDGSLIPRGYASDKDDADMISETLEGLTGIETVTARTTEEDWNNDVDRSY